MNKFTRIASAVAMIAAATVVVSGCTAFLDWPEAGTQYSTKSPSTRPSTPAPIKDVEEPPADGALHPYGSPNLWMNNGYVNGVEEVEFDGQLCFVSAEDEVVISETYKGIIGVGFDGKEAWKVPDLSCAGSYSGVDAVPIVRSYEEGLFVLDPSTGKTTSILATPDGYDYSFIDVDEKNDLTIFSHDDYTNPETVVAARDGKVVWEVPISDGPQAYGDCFVFETTTRCSAAGRATIIDNATGTVTMTHTTPGEYASITWGTDYFLAYDDDYNETVYDLKAQPLQVSIAFGYVTPTKAIYSLADVQDKDSWDMPIAMTIEGNTAATQDGGKISTPTGGKLSSSYAYLDFVSADGRTFLMTFDDGSGLVAANGQKIFKMDDDVYIELQNGFLTAMNDDYDSGVVWIPAEKK